MEGNLAGYHNALDSGPNNDMPLSYGFREPAEPFQEAIGGNSILNILVSQTYLIAETLQKIYEKIYTLSHGCQTHLL